MEWVGPAATSQGRNAALSRKACLSKRKNKFKSSSEREQEKALALISALGTVASSKGKGAERLEALATVVAALGIAPESIQSVEIDWKIIRANRSDELVPVLRMVSADGTTKELEQLDT
ncbi:hypothetical protein D3C85_98550 [compost metagenome]